MTNQEAVRNGAYELRSLYPVYAIRGLAIAVVLHLSVIGCYYLASALEGHDVPPPVITVTIDSFLPPPSNTKNVAVPGITVASPSKGEARATPIMVPDAEVSVDNTIAAQPTMNPDPVSTGGSNGEGGEVNYQLRPVIESDAEPPPFQAVEKLPVPIANPSPEYPEIARKAGIEGTVYLRVWVTKTGKVKKVEVVRSTADLLTQAAIDAASQWVFTPAIMNNGPVAVWISIPFKFAIRTGG